MKTTAAIVCCLVSLPALGQSTTADKLRQLTGSRDEATAIAFCQSPAARPDQQQGLLSGFCEALELVQNGPFEPNPQAYERIIGQVLAEGQRRGLQP